MFDFSIVSSWIHTMLTSVMPEGWAVFIECVLVALWVITLYALLAIALIYMERKICGFFQCRLGPNRVGKWGIFQVIADVLKMLTKEIFNPKKADQFLYNLAPFLVILASFLTFACLPINKGTTIIDFNVGIFFLIAASSIGVLGIMLSGWGSYNKYSLIGAMRSGAQIISYEMSVGLSIMLVALGVCTSTEPHTGGLGYMASMFHLFTHAMFKALLFLCAGCIIEAVHSNEISAMGGMRKYMPITHITFLVACLAISGIPPFSGFFSKDEILSACFMFSPIMGWVMTIIAAMTAFYMFRLYYSIFWGNENKELHGLQAFIGPVPFVDSRCL